MGKIYFMSSRKGKGTLDNPVVGWIAAEGQTGKDGVYLLTNDCISVHEIEDEAKRLKKMIDRAVAAAKNRLPE
jgi:hypothetical protein